jgi:hypothetical protein
MDEIDDRRGSGRVYIMTTATLEVNGQSIEATAMDISATGISVWAPEGVNPSGPIGLQFEIDEKGPIKLTGVLARQFESDGGSVWGIHFEGVDPAITKRLEAYVESLAD